jgi:hypothetical protein
MPDASQETTNNESQGSPSPTGVPGRPGSLRAMRGHRSLPHDATRPRPLLAYASTRLPTQALLSAGTSERCGARREWLVWHGAPPTPWTAIVATRWWQLDRVPAEHAQTESVPSALVRRWVSFPQGQAPAVAELRACAISRKFLTLWFDAPRCRGQAHSYGHDLTRELQLIGFNTDRAAVQLGVSLSWGAAGSGCRRDTA